MEDTEIRLLSEQIRHTLDLLDARTASVEARLAFSEEIIRLRLAALESSQADQEARLRALADSVVRLNTSASLAQVGQAAFALVLSALAAYLGSRR